MRAPQKLALISLQSLCFLYTAPVVGWFKTSAMPSRTRAAFSAFQGPGGQHENQMHHPTPLCRFRACLGQLLDGALRKRNAVLVVCGQARLVVCGKLRA